MKHNISMAMSMLNTILNNKWKPEVRNERIKIGFKITKDYISEAEQLTLKKEN